MTIPLTSTSEIDVTAFTSQFANDFGVWLSIVRDWLGAWTGLPFPKMRPGPPSVTGTFTHDDGTREGASAGGPSLVLSSSPSVLAGSPLVEAAFQAASESWELPTQYSLLMRAIDEFHEGKFRESVIDACSAVEVSLAEALRRHFETTNTNADSVERLLKDAGGVVELYHAYAAICGAELDVSDKRVMHQLARPRNASVHAAHLPSASDAQSAWETAKLLVNDATPLLHPHFFLSRRRRRK